MSHLSFRGRPFQAECTRTHSNGMVSLTFTETQNTKKAKPKVYELHYLCAYVISHNGSSDNHSCYPPDSH